MRVLFFRERKVPKESIAKGTCAQGEVGRNGGFLRYKSVGPFVPTDLGCDFCSDIMEK